MTSTTKVYGRFAAIGGAAISLPFASAGTIYSGVQNINQTESVGNPISYDLFLTPSQVTPFVFRAVWSETLNPEPYSQEGVTLQGTTATSEYVLNTTPFFGGPEVIEAGEAIDGSATFGSAELYLVGIECSGKKCLPPKPIGRFSQNAPQFVGVRFTTSGGPFDGLHYGWIRLTSDMHDINSPDREYTIVDWAFESDPGVAITAGDTGSANVPEPSSLALFAAGAAGLAALRLKRKTRKS
jgi:hypothetical protein